MGRYILFYGEQEYGEFDDYQAMKEEVDGAALIDGYIWDKEKKCWRQWHVHGKLPLEDIPPVLRTMMLILGE